MSVFCRDVDPLRCLYCDDGNRFLAPIRRLQGGVRDVQRDVSPSRHLQHFIDFAALHAPVHTRDIFWVLGRVAVY